MLTLLTHNGGNAMEQYFYVLYNVNEKALYADTPSGLGYTINILYADRYESYEEAKEYLSYFKSPQEWEVKKVTMSIEL